MQRIRKLMGILLFLTLLTACSGATAGSSVASSAPSSVANSVPSSVASSQVVSSTPASSGTNSVSIPAISSNEISSSESDLTSSSMPQNQAYLDEIYEKYVKPLNPNSRITSYAWATPNDIRPDDLVDFCAYNDLLHIMTNGIFHAPAEKLEVAISQYFNGISPEYLRTSRMYEYGDSVDKGFPNTYIMVEGGGGGDTKALAAEQDGDLLHIVVGQYIITDLQETYLLTVRLEENGFKYLSYELYTQDY